MIPSKKQQQDQMDIYENINDFLNNIFYVNKGMEYDIKNQSKRKW